MNPTSTLLRQLSFPSAVASSSLSRLLRLQPITAPLTIRLITTRCTNNAQKAKWALSSFSRSPSHHSPCSSLWGQSCFSTAPAASRELEMMSELQTPSTGNTNSSNNHSETKPKKKSSRAAPMMKDPISLTDRAADRIKELLSNQPTALGIRLGVKRRGCNGLSYTLNYVYQQTQQSDQEKNSTKKDIHMMSPQGVDIWIEPMALFSIVGTQMDWEETELTSEFTFHNPNSKGQCGCGESFNV